ncbi:LysM peptidoglycan-binding domain-containing protein [Trichloromonas sp.]|uniref:LysM peptidoglycan-binding domain-containing protein n=1 Tax=Trichloromonas sp. TaxID=3069249 RepID=UPI003D8162BF
MHRTFIILIALSIFSYGCASPPRKELEAARIAISKAHASGAPELAPGKYQTAVEVMTNGEELVTRGQYRLARETFPYAEALAQQAIHAAREEQLRRDLEETRNKEKLELLKKQLKEEQKSKPKQPPKTASKPAPAKPKPLPPPPPPPPPPVTSYLVGNGETLWFIAAQKQVYQDAFLWPLIYRANRDQIKDPRQIYPGQTLNIPRNLSEEETKEARATARKSDIFPLDLLIKASPGKAR